MQRFSFTALCLILLSFIANAQDRISGRVVDSESLEPLPFVNITVDGTLLGTATDIDGRFVLRMPENRTQLNFSYVGYEKKKVDVSGKKTNLVIKLIQVSSTLDAVTILPGVNPAHRIIKNAVDNKKLNDPSNIPSFSYNTYSKFIATINTDSVDPALDTINFTDADTSYTRIDSSNYNLVKAMEKQHLFMMESVTQRQYIKGKRDNETVLANRVSGFKNPLFSLFITQLQSFSFYDDYISITGEDYLNPVTKGSTARYFFILEDTLYNTPEDTVFIISYLPRKNYAFSPLKGLLYINTSDWAIQNVIAEPYESEGLEIRIRQQYKRFGPHRWFPVQLDADLDFKTVKINDAYPYAKMRTYLSKIQIDKELRKKDISRAEVTIAPDAVDNAEELLNEYRTDTLEARELRTYEFMDSINDTLNLDRNLRILTAFIRGSIPVYFVDVELNKILNANAYEGIRLGIGGHTNFRFSEIVKLGGYVGYGFRDKVWKYGWDAELSLHKHSNFKVKMGYQFDIFESAAPEFLQLNQGGLFADNYRRLFVPQWDEATRYFGSVTYDPTPKLHGKVQVQRENRTTVGDYFFYNESNQDNPVWQNGFNYFEVITSLRYAPNEKFVEGGEFGKLRFAGGSPVFLLQYTRGLNDVWNSNFSYDKIDFRVMHTFKTLYVGQTTLSLQAGTVLNDVPYSKLYTGTSNMINKPHFWDRFMIADRNSFETMRFNEFLSDSYVHLMYRQDLKSLLFRRENFEPHIEFVTRAMVAELRSPELHEGIAFKEIQGVYLESGLELNKLYIANFTGLGLGFYYRYGDNALPNFEDNFALKLTSKFSF